MISVADNKEFVFKNEWYYFVYHSSSGQHKSGSTRMGQAKYAICLGSFMLCAAARLATLQTTITLSVSSSVAKMLGNGFLILSD